MERKEVYGTTGPRILVRFFGGWDYTAQDLNSRQPAFRGYEKGVPMGGDLRARSSGDAPTFMVYALRDVIGANLDRIQIVKGWLDAKGNTHEKVYDVAWSTGREPDANGVLPPVGNTVDIAAANWTNTIGASELGTVWTDPDFDPSRAPSTTPACWKSRPRAGSSTTRSVTVSRYPKTPKPPTRSAWGSVPWSFQHTFSRSLSSKV